MKGAINILNVETKRILPELDDEGNRREALGATIVMSTNNLDGLNSVTTYSHNTRTSSVGTDIVASRSVGNTSGLEMTGIGGISDKNANNTLPKQPNVLETPGNKTISDIPGAAYKFTTIKDVNTNIDELYEGNPDEGETQHVHVETEGGYVTGQTS